MSNILKIPLTSHISLLTTIILAGCTPQSSVIHDVIQTASGRITEVRNRVDEAVQPVVETVETVNRGVKKVQSGAQMIQDGIESVQDVIDR